MPKFWVKALTFGALALIVCGGFILGMLVPEIAAMAAAAAFGVAVVGATVYDAVTGVPAAVAAVCTIVGAAVALGAAITVGAAVAVGAPVVALAAIAVAAVGIAGVLASVATNEH